MLNFKQLAKEHWKTQQDLSGILGIAQSKVSVLMNNPQKISPEIMERLIAHFGKEVVESYMDHSDRHVRQMHTVEATIIPADIVNEIKEELRNDASGNGNHVTNTPSKDQPEEVPIEETLILDADIVRAPNYDIVEKFKDGTLDAEVKPTQYIVPDHTMKVYTDCDDMAPVVCAGEPVLIKVLPKDVPILHGRMYFVDLPAGAVIRYVFEEGENLILKAANAAYKDIVVPRAEVLSVSMVVLIMKRPTAMPNDRLSFMAELDRRNAQVDNLIEQIDKAGDRESRLIEIIEKHNQ